MGGIWSYLLGFWSPTPQYDPTPDPATGLTQKDRELITQTWALVADKKTIKPNAVEFFMQLFQSYPYTQQHFPLFKGKEISELRTSPKMKAHAASVFYVISSYVENLDDPETLVNLVQKVAVSHIGRNIFSKEFEDLRVVFLNFVRFLLGAQCTPEIEGAWDKLLLAQIAVFKATEKELGKPQ